MSLVAWTATFWLTTVWNLPSSKQDFNFFYDAAAALRDGRPAYQGTSGVALLPPHALLPVQLLLNFSPVVAAYVWLVANVLALAASVAVVLRETGWHPTRIEIAALVSLPALTVHTTANQCAWLLALPAALGWRDLRRGHDASAGAWLGLVTAVKPFLLPLGLLLLWRRRWHAVATWILTGVALLVFGAAWYGVDVYRGWLSAGNLITWYHVGSNASFLGVAARLVPSAHPALHQLTPLGWAIVVAGAMAVLMLSCYWLRSAPDVDRDVAITVLAILLVCPLGWVYYLPLLAGPLIVMWQRGSEAPTVFWFGILPLWWPAGVGWFPPATSPLWRRVAPESFYLCGLVFLWVLAGLTVVRVHRSETRNCIVAPTNDLGAPRAQAAL